MLVEARRSERVQLVHVFLCMLSARSCSYCKLWTIVAESSTLPRAHSLLCGTLRDELGGNVFYLFFHAMQQYLELFEAEVEHFSGWFFMPSRSSFLLCREMAHSIYGECAMYEYIYLDHQTLFLRGWISQSAIGGPSMLTAALTYILLTAALYWAFSASTRTFSLSSLCFYLFQSPVP